MQKSCDFLTAKFFNADCTVSKWEAYSECSTTCGKNGMKTKKRRIIQVSQNGGRPCPSLEQTDQCQTQHSCVLYMTFISQLTSLLTPFFI